MSDFMPSNGAGDMLLSFFDWGYRTPKPLQAGTKRRLNRESLAKKALAAFYLETPSYPPSRQMRRRAAILKARKLSDRKHGWRDQLETLNEARA